MDACDWSPEDNGCREVEGSRGSDQAIVRAPGLFYFCSSWADPLCGPSPGVFWKFLEVIYFGESLNSAPGPGSSVRVPGCGLAARGLSDLGCGAQGVVSESPDETVVSGAARVAMFEWTATSQLAPSSGHTARCRVTGPRPSPGAGPRESPSSAWSAGPGGGGPGSAEDLQWCNESDTVLLERPVVPDV